MHIGDKARFYKPYERFEIVSAAAQTVKLICGFGDYTFSSRVGQSPEIHGRQPGFDIRNVTVKTFQTKKRLLSSDILTFPNGGQILGIENNDLNDIDWALRIVQGTKFLDIGNYVADNRSQTLNSFTNFPIVVGPGAKLQATTSLPGGGLTPYATVVYTGGVEP